MTEIKSNAEIEPCLSVIMPVFNEAATVAGVVKTVLAQRLVRELVIVDDASKDGTWEKLQPIAQNEPRIKLVRHEINQGKGAALRTGFALATAAVVVIQDADLEYDPAEYHRLIGPILSGKADVVFGSRFTGCQCAPGLVLLALLGNRMLTTILEHGDRSEPDGHGDLLQNVPARNHPENQDRGGPLWLRAGNHGQGRAA